MTQTVYMYYAIYIRREKCFVKNSPNCLYIDLNLIDYAVRAEEHVSHSNFQSERSQRQSVHLLGDLRQIY